jgi:putative transposase
MTKRKRHSAIEIASKLAHADALAAQGRRNQEIARALGVSVMTFHRWRKFRPLRPDPHSDHPAPPQHVDQLSGPDALGQIAELQIENSRLRRLVTDLLLEKIKLEESILRRGPKRDPKR